MWDIEPNVTDTVDEIHFAPPRKPWYDDSPVNTNQQMASHGFKVVQEFVHPQYVDPGSMGLTGKLDTQAHTLVILVGKPKHKRFWEAFPF